MAFTDPTLKVEGTETGPFAALAHLFAEAGKGFKKSYEVDPSRLRKWMKITEELMALEPLNPGRTGGSKEAQKHEVEAHAQARA